MPDKTVIRCSECELFQYVPQNGLCRRCKHDLRGQVTPTQHRMPAGAPKQETIKKIMPIEDETLPEAFGNTLRVIRQALFASQKDVALIMGVPRTYISKVETGKAMPSIKQINRIAEALNIPASTLLVMATSK